LPLQEEPARRLRRLLRELPRPAAIWCGEDALGVAVCEAAEGLGLRIPEDVAVLGLGNFRAADCSSPPLSSIPLPGERIGHQAFAVLDRKLSGELGLPSYLPVEPPPVVVRQSTFGDPTRDPLMRALALIADRACEGITVGEIAKAVALSTQTLNTRFQQRFGRSPGDEIRRTKLATAKRHLADPRLSIARIADLCGFNQQSKFSNFFRRETGVSPRVWRQENSGADLADRKDVAGRRLQAPKRRI
jgi:LacI family transcriptional regulator